MSVPVLGRRQEVPPWLLRLQLLTFAGLPAALLITAVLHRGPARVAYLVAAAAFVTGPLLAMRRLRQVEHADAAEAPGMASLVTEAMARLGWFVNLMSMLIIGIPWFAGAMSARDAPPWIAWLVAGTIASGIAGATLHAALTQWQKRGVEREVFLEATCIAFLVTIIACGAYGIIDAIAGAPEVPLWSAWALGMGAWWIATCVRISRLS